MPHATSSFHGSHEVLHRVTLGEIHDMITEITLVSVIESWHHFQGHGHPEKNHWKSSGPRSHMHFLINLEVSQLISVFFTQCCKHSNHTENTLSEPWRSFGYSTLCEEWVDVSTCWMDCISPTVVISLFPVEHSCICYFFLLSEVFWPLLLSFFRQTWLLRTNW